MDRKFTLNDIRVLRPSLIGEKEVFIIKTTNNDMFLELYLNTYYGCEYTLYAGDFAELEGGVIDDVDYEDEGTVLNLIVNLLPSICQDVRNVPKHVCLQNSVERTSILWYNHYINDTVLWHVRR
jgi:hypothetical protein